VGQVVLPALPYAADELLRLISAAQTHLEAACLHAEKDTGQYSRHQHISTQGGCLSPSTNVWLSVRP
jgi:hypothetical protein